MKIVNIEDYFHPEAGYQINILPKYMAKMGHEVTIITSEMDKIPTELISFFGCDDIEKKDKEYMEQSGVKIIRLPLHAFISGRAVFFEKILFKTIKIENPDIVYVHGNDTLTGMQYLLKRKKMNYPLVMDSHMLEMASKNKLNKAFRRVYRCFFTPIIIKDKIQVIRTQDDPYVEKALGIPLTQAPWISYGSDTMLFHPDEAVKKKFRTENGIGDNDFVVVYTGKLDESKGGKLLAETFRKKFNTRKNIVLVVVGSTAGAYGKEVDKLFAESENRIIRFPTRRYSDLPRFYQSADLSVFAKQCSLSFYDAQACGLPVLSEDNNINIDRCGHNNGWNFKSDNAEDFRKKIEAAADMNDGDYRAISDNAYKFIIENYNYEDKAREYENVILNVINNEKGRME